MVTIFFAISLSKAELPHWFNWILVAFVAFHVFIHLLLSVSSIVIHVDLHSPTQLSSVIFMHHFVVREIFSMLEKDLFLHVVFRIFEFYFGYLFPSIHVLIEFITIFFFFHFSCLSLIIPLPLICQITITLSNVIIVRFSFGFRFVVALANGMRNVLIISQWPICHRHAVA